MYLSHSLAKEDTASCSGCRRGQHSPQQKTKTTSTSCELCGTESRLNQQQKLRSSDRQRTDMSCLGKKLEFTCIGASRQDSYSRSVLSIEGANILPSKAGPVQGPARPHQLPSHLPPNLPSAGFIDFSSRCSLTESGPQRK